MFSINSKSIRKQFKKNMLSLGLVIESHKIAFCSIIIVFALLGMYFFSNELWFQLLMNLEHIISPFSSFIPILIPLFGIFGVILSFYLQNRQKLIDDKKNTLLDVVKQTQLLWIDISNLVGKIRYYDGKKPIEEIRMELDKSRVKIKELSNIWYFYFEKIPEYPNLLEEGDNIHYSYIMEKPFFILLDSANTVANFIHDNPQLRENKVIRGKKELQKLNELLKEKRKYQFALGIIENNINLIYYDPLITVLFNYINFKYKKGKAKKKSKIEIENHYNNMMGWYKAITKVERNNDNFSFLKDSKDTLVDFETIQSFYNKIEHESRKELNKRKEHDENAYFKPKDHEKFKELKKLYRRLNYEDRRYTLCYPYSKECLIKLSDYLDFQKINRDLELAVNLPKYSNISFKQKHLLKIKKRPVTKTDNFRI